MAKTLLKVANSLTKNVSSNKIITDTKKSEKNERKDRGRSLDAKRMARGAGILLAITSLPSSYGIGTLGDAAFQFIDKDTGRYFQLAQPVLETVHISHIPHLPGIHI